MKRRQMLGLLAGSASVPVAVQASQPATRRQSDYDVTGTSAPLAFRLHGTPDNKIVTEADFRGAVTMLYFGYTFCPDVCPLTMQNVATALGKAGAAARQVRFLFTTVDPGRDTMAVLSKYVALFGPQFVGLRGGDDELMRLAKRYRIAYSVDPSPDPARYEVVHSAVIYVFDKQGNARLLVSSMDAQNPDIDGLAADLVRLVDEKPSWWSWLRGMA